MTFEEWVQTYRPLKGDTDEHDGYAFTLTSNAVRDADPRHVWTVVEADGTVALIDGIHWVNRECYLITEVRAPDLFHEIILHEDEDFDEAL